MKTLVTTTIKSWVDLDSLTPEHEVDNSSDDPLPEEFVRAVAEGGLKSALVALGSQDFVHESQDFAHE